MADSFFNLEDEPLPSFLSSSLDSTSGPVALGNVTLGSGPGFPVAASTVAKIRAGADIRGNVDDVSYLEGGQLSSNGEKANFCLSFKDDMDNAEDYIAAHGFMDMLVKIPMDESQSSARGSQPFKSMTLQGRATDLGSDLSTGLLTFAQYMPRDTMDTKVQPLQASTEEDGPASDEAGSDGFSVASFLANEKLMSVDSINSDLTDDEVDLNNLPDDELELYFKTLVPPAMQRGRVEGQEIPATGLSGLPNRTSNTNSIEQENNREQFLDDYDQDDFQMPDVRLAATGMDSCPASDEDTEDELEAARAHSFRTNTSRNNTSRTQLLLPSTSRQLVGESNRPSFRPGLEGGSSDDEASSGRGGPPASGIEHRRSAEGQVINPPVAGGDGGGGDGSSGSDESGNDGGGSAAPLPATTYDVLRGLGIVGSSGEGGALGLSHLPGFGRNGFSGPTEMGDRVGPVGTGEASSPPEAPASAARISPVNWSMSVDRQEALDAMDSTQSGPTAETALDSLYMRTGSGHWRPNDSAVTPLQGSQSSFRLSQVLPDWGAGGCDDAEDEDEDGVDVADGGRLSLGFRGGPCGGGTAAGPPESTSEEENHDGPSSSLEAKYFSKSFQHEQEESDDDWNHCPGDLEAEFKQGDNAPDSVVYQNEEGKWVTDLAYYSSFQKEVDGNAPENTGQLQTEEFVPASTAIDKIIEDQQEFEKEHQFMQEEQIEAAGESLTLGDTSWKIPTSSDVLMRASQASSEFERGNHSYLRLSLGQFFGQRSEALGCLGGADDDLDGVKRPSFGYIITSPEKRDPFALIRPSDVSSRDSSVHSNTIELVQQDQTLNAEDLDKTLEAPCDRMSPKGDPDPQLCEEAASSPASLPGDPHSAPGSVDQSLVSPANTSAELMLSISTITSAIADASISADPSQLAAMIMELSRRSKAKGRHSNTGIGASSVAESTSPLQHVDHSVLLEALQKSTCAGELGAFDMERYLRKADASRISTTSDSSLAHTTFDLSAWASNLAASQDGLARGEEWASARSVASSGTNEDRHPRTRSDSLPGDEDQPPRTRSDSLPGTQQPRRSGIPRPKAPSLPTPARRSGTAGEPPTAKSSADSRALSGTAADGGRPPPHASAAPPSATAEYRAAPGKVGPRAHTPPRASSQAPQKNQTDPGVQPGPPGTSPVLGKGRSGLPCLRGSSPLREQGQPRGQPVTSSSGPENRSQPPQQEAQRAEVPCRSSRPPAPHAFMTQSSSEPSAGEESTCHFRPSTCPLIHSSPSQTSFPGDCTMSSPPTSRTAADRRPDCERSPQSTCSSPSLCRLTYISINDGTAVPAPDRKPNDQTIALSTTIVRASPTPPLEPDSRSHLDGPRQSKSLDSQLPSHQSKSLDPLPPPSSRPCRSPERSGSALSCTRSQSECHFHSRDPAQHHPPAGCGLHTNYFKPTGPPLTKVDSGYASNLNIHLPGQGSQQWGAIDPASAQACPGGGLGLPPAYSSEELRYAPPFSGFMPPGPGLAGQTQRPGMQPLFAAGRSLFSSQLAQQYPGAEGTRHPVAYHIGPYGLAPGGDPSSRHLQDASGPAGYHQLHRPQNSRAELGMMGKAFGQPSVEPWAAAGLDELRGQVVVPGELRFPHACCVGIASQASLSLFNPSERWQQVSITVSSLALDGAKVDSLPYQWLLVKNKTIMGPKSTEEQKVLLVPPQAGVYQCVLSVSSWPASAEPDLGVRADVFAKRVLLVAVAEDPMLEIEAGKSGSLDFGDLSEGLSKSLPLKVLNRTHATVPIRLVISANASAWRCFTFSKNPVALTAEESLQAGHMTQLSSPSVMNHVMHASYGENPESFMIWVHFRAPQKYPSSGELGPAEEFMARIDIEVDSPGPSHVIRSVPLQARVGTARVHAPKDLQTISLSAPLGQARQQDLPLKNAGNIEVKLKLKCKDAEDCFSVRPDELYLVVGEEKTVEVSFNAQGSKKCRESLLTILVLPTGPQYEVALRGEVAAEIHGKPAASAPGPAADVPPILSNKQFVAWGGVTLGRAVQQKLVLRNNSADGTQQLRLLIRGQDQDCFQLQSMFSPEERLTRHGELSIRPREDVAVHLLFAPTRVACMLAKLEIKQSGLRPSQPGVKFTIPLSGYGGTSNIILEDQRKEADGYVATLAGVAVGRVSKVCLCVRNTGSRAAFIKATAFSDLQSRSLMEPSVISLSPSQFVLKERTQEVITVLLKATQRETSLCHSAQALLATVCLFCGDEVSRQQYRRLLQSRPEAGRKVLSDNSLLKNIDFNETFLGEELITETFDLPQRPNEGHVFYGNMSKVVLSLLGTTSRPEPGDVERAEPVQHSAGHAAESHSAFANGNITLDVLPVKGPQGPPLRAAEPMLKDKARADEEKTGEQGTWSVHPDQLVLTAPTMNGTATTRHVHIRNNSGRGLSFELSWPAHCLTITPQHGLIEPQSHLQILISPNPSLASKTSMLPWSGQIYIQCDGTQKFIKAQIRRDLALDVSPAPAERSLSALAPQAATPLPSLVRPDSQASQPPDLPQSPQALLELGSKTVVFPATPSGESSESVLEVDNGEEEVRWYLSSFAPPYVKGVDNSGDVYRATYTAFRCSRVSGTLGARQKMQVPITFLPRDRGDYAQFWDLECHPLLDPQLKTRVRFQLCGTGVKSGPVEAPQEGDCSLVKTESSIKTRKRTEAAPVKTVPEEAVRKGVYSPQDLYTFPATRLGQSSTLKVNIRNNSSDTHELNFVNPREPFHIKHSKYSLRSQHYLRLPVQFKPSAAGPHAGLLLVQSETSGGLVIQLTGEGLP
ncbi:centrosomal protein of 192 kDa [Gadus macrocephalus]|uniref:centrosomal protein of 192 kDa n=1 Tax=Gadus macrocephalus TaxID=80720 RepID=UPI0028CB9CC4|nr:centrosomal protein of 192 kDa [Gadus macrocephalus]